MTASRGSRGAPLRIGDVELAPGERRRLDLPAALLPTHTRVNLPLCVLNGLAPGPRLWLSAAVHGDELNGVEIISRVLAALPERLPRGALIAAPVVNVFGFLGQSRYLPDRRDLNRSFPGSARGSLAARIAHLFMTEVVARCSHGIDLHTGSADRCNLPQIRADLRDPMTRRCAESFGPPVIVQSVVRDGSLRAAATARGVCVLVYEAGEPQRFNADAIDIGVRGVLGVMRDLGMLARRSRRRRPLPQVVEQSRWVRARTGGLLRLQVEEGDSVVEGQVVGSIGDPFGESRVVLRAPFHGLVIGRTNNPVVNGGDAVLHIGKVGAAAGGGDG